MAENLNTDTKFQKGNNIWKIAFERGTIGRNRIFETPQQLTDGINEWLEVMKERVWKKEDFIKSGPNAGEKVYLDTATPLTIQSLCLFLGVHSQYLNDFERGLENMKDREMASEFSLIITRIKEIISNQKLEGAMVGAYNPMIVARIEGLKDKQDITSDGKGFEAITSIKITREDAKQISQSLDDEV
jgi:hypothetical protein